MIDCLFFCCWFVCFETRSSYITQAGLKLRILCLHLLGAGITEVQCHTQLPVTSLKFSPNTHGALNVKRHNLEK
jgi:hypothetical protein